MNTMDRSRIFSLLALLLVFCCRDVSSVEPTAPIKSFTFVVDDKVEETPNPYLSKFRHSDLLGKSDGTEPVVARSSIDLDSSSTYRVGGHSFVDAAISAYNKHMHLVVRPDNVWIAIITQFSFYVNANAEELRDKFVSFKDKKDLEVKSAGTLHTGPYEELALLMSDQIAANIKDPSIRDWVIPNFSTTSNTDKVVGAFALMANLKEYFRYKFSMACGLPKVTILGSVDDWKQIRNRTERLVEFDTKKNYMKKWVEMLLPVIDNFISSADGKPNTRWWNQITHHIGGGSGPTYISGWITVFTVFNDKGKWNLQSFKEGTMVESDDIPKGFVSCPLKIDDNGKLYDADIYAGHIVAKVTNGYTTIIPQLDWSILVKN